MSVGSQYTYTDEFRGVHLISLRDDLGNDLERQTINDDVTSHCYFYANEEMARPCVSTVHLDCDSALSSNH